VPYLLWIAPDPAVAASLKGAAPRLDAARRASAVSLDVPQDRLPLTSLELSTEAQPFHRTVSLSWLREGRPGVEPPSQGSLGGASWFCEGSSLLPCRLSLPIYSGPSGHLEVQIEDGDNPPLVSVDAVLWRRRHLLVFAWPAKGQVTMRGGAEEVGPPRYDLADLRDQVLARPRLVAALQPLAGGPAASEQRWGRAALIGALALAALLLLGLLARALRTGPNVPRDGK
jgi:hypothetical protein